MEVLWWRKQKILIITNSNISVVVVSTSVKRVHYCYIEE